MTNRRGAFTTFSTAVLRFLRLKGAHGSEFSDVVLHPRLKQHVMRLADATGSAKKRKMPLQHVMFYGPPGTGKTMVAQRFAEYSGLEYAIMSGGDVAPLEEQAVTELHKLFKWVHRSRRGVLLFIDEADAFLTSRTQGNMSESLRNALTTMLYHTGTPSSQFMLVLATNRPGDLDSAILDRIDESVEFGLPDPQAREQMVKLYYETYVSKPLGFGQLKVPAAKASTVGKNGHSSSPNGSSPSADSKAPIDIPALAEASRQLDGFSGREIAKLFTSFQTHVLYSMRDTLNSKKQRKIGIPRNLLFDVVQQKVSEHKRTADFLVSGYMYKHESVSSRPTPSGRQTPSRTSVTPSRSRPTPRKDVDRVGDPKLDSVPAQRGNGRPHPLSEVESDVQNGNSTAVNALESKASDKIITESCEPAKTD
jgi:SpoVK/Ycf46/Vps4 family AAA+-type ATPase